MVGYVVIVRKRAGHMYENAWKRMNGPGHDQHIFILGCICCFHMYTHYRLSYMYCGCTVPSFVYKQRSVWPISHYHVRNKIAKIIFTAIWINWIVRILISQVIVNINSMIPEHKMILLELALQWEIHFSNPLYSTQIIKVFA